MAKKKKSGRPASYGQMTLGQLKKSLFEGARDDQILLWPPNVFAYAAQVLRLSGAYVRILDYKVQVAANGKGTSGIASNAQIGSAARSWRGAARVFRGQKAPKGYLATLPADVVAWWQIVNSAESRRKKVVQVLQSNKLVYALLNLVAVADETCQYVSTPRAARGGKFSLAAQRELYRSGTFAAHVDPVKAKVVPKFHTPKSGLSFRSLSHYLALIVGNEVEMQFHLTPIQADNDLNILLLPWPRSINRAQFRTAAAPPASAANYGYAEFLPEPLSKADRSWFKKVIGEARKEASGKIDGIVLPECALLPQDAAWLVAYLRKENLFPFLVAGLLVPPSAKGAPAANIAYFSRDVSSDTVVEFAQAKHHRWLITHDQVRKYCLEKQLPPGKNDTDYWEYIRPLPREINFLYLTHDVSICILICEDLARQEPIGDIVRAVGPDLVIALLQDGPQLSNRWPAQYATVLADDPGSSVLTVSSSGMIDLAFPDDTKYQAKHSVALWKQADKFSSELTLKKNADALLLKLEVSSIEEFTASGRGDGGTSSRVALVQLVQLGVRS